MMVSFCLCNMTPHYIKMERIFSVIVHLSKGYPHRIAQKPHERFGGGEGLRNMVDECFLECRRILHVSNGNEVGTSQIFDTRMIGGETQRTFLQTASIKIEKRVEFLVVSHSPPASRIFYDTFPNLPQDSRFGSPQTGSQKTRSRFEMDIKSRSVDVPTEFVTELDAYVRFVRFGSTVKAGITVHSHQRTA